MMNTKLRRTMMASVFALAGTMTATGAALAASDGNMGATSTGTLNITAQIPNLVRLTKLNDINLGTWDGSSDMTGSDDVCVYSSTRSYTVSASGDGPAGAFSLSDGSGNSISYSVSWEDDSNNTETLSAGTASSAMSANTNSAACSGGTNATVSVGVSSANASTAPAGTYNGTLTLVVEPQ